MMGRMTPTPLECWLLEEEWGPWAPFNLAGIGGSYAAGSAFVEGQHWYYLLDRKTFQGEVTPIPEGKDPSEYARERVGELMSLGKDLLCYIKRMPKRVVEYRYRTL